MSLRFAPTYVTMYLPIITHKSCCWDIGRCISLHPRQSVSDLYRQCRGCHSYIKMSVINEMLDKYRYLFPMSGSLKINAISVHIFSVTSWLRQGIINLWKHSDKIWAWTSDLSPLLNTRSLMINFLCLPCALLCTHINITCLIIIRSCAD